MKESYDCDCGICGICNGLRKPGETISKETELKYNGPIMLPISICKKTHNHIVEPDGAIIAECPTKAITETFILAANSHQSLTQQRDKAIKLLEYFVNRVEQGTIRSKTTYSMYKQFLAEIK